VSPEERISRELRSYVDRIEAESIDRVGERLMEERPIPPARFRATLRARLFELADSPGVRGPRRLALAVGAYAGGGVFLLGIAALGAAGSGPLAP
jgi:hypothetical protein